MTFTLLYIFLSVDHSILWIYRCRSALSLGLLAYTSKSRKQIYFQIMCVYETYRNTLSFRYIVEVKELGQIYPFSKSITFDRPLQAKLPDKPKKTKQNMLLNQCEL